jgi:nitrogen fixation NifU-like protein
MQKYSKNLVDLFYNAKFSGAISGADVIVKNQDEESGEIVKVYLVVRNDILYDCSFQAKGSIVLYASLTTICSLSKEKTLSEILSINERDVINELKQLNKQEYKEVVFALESFKKAVVTYSKRKQQGTIVEKNNLKAKNLHPAKNITRYQESSRPCNIEMALSNKDNDSKGADSDFMQSEKIEDKKVVKTQKIVQIENQEKNLDKPSAIDRNMQKLEALINEVKLEQPVKVNKELEEEQLLVRVRNYTEDYIIAYYMKDKYCSKNGKRFYSDTDCDYPIYIKNIIAWKEIVLPELKENE